MEFKKGEKYLWKEVAILFILHYNNIEKWKEVILLYDEELFKKMLMTFDHKYEAASVFYDNLPYVRDYDLCNWTPLRMFSGNIIKFYQYKMDKPVIIQTDPDCIS